MDGLKDYQAVGPVQAKPMTRKEFVDFTCRIPSEQYEPSEAGFVIYHPSRPLGQEYEWLPLQTFLDEYVKVPEAS